MKKPNHYKNTIEKPTYGKDKAKGSASKKGASNGFPKNEGLKGKW